MSRPPPPVATGSSDQPALLLSCRQSQTLAKPEQMTTIPRMPVLLPSWLQRVREDWVVGPIRRDPRTREDMPFGISISDAFDGAIGGGQTDFDEPWQTLSASDRVHLYAYLNQLGHLEELYAAFVMLFADERLEAPIVVDVGCGPFTGGLAFAAATGCHAFTYIGVDTSAEMRRFGEQLASAAITEGGLSLEAKRLWASSLADVAWEEPPGWRPVIVIVSYLLASPSVDVELLVHDLESLLRRLGRGVVVVLYTNAPSSSPNRNFVMFRESLIACGFSIKKDEMGSIVTQRYRRQKARELRYALLYRDKQKKLNLRGN